MTVIQSYRGLRIEENLAGIFRRRLATSNTTRKQAFRSEHLATVYTKSPPNIVFTAVIAAV